MVRDTLGDLVREGFDVGGLLNRGEQRTDLSVELAAFETGEWVYAPITSLSFFASSTRP